MANFLGSNYTADQVNAVPGLAVKAKGLLGLYQQQRMAGTYAGGPTPADIINNAMADPIAFEKKALAGTVANAIESSYDGNSTANQTAAAKEIIDYLQKNNVPANELNSLIQSGKDAGESFNAFRSKSTDTSIFGAIMQLIPVAIVAIAAPEAAPAIGAEMGLSGAAANAAGMAAIGATSSAITAAGNGASADQVAKAAVVGGAAGAVGGAAAPLAGEIASTVGPQAASIISNAATGAAKSVISGSDPLAGAAAGAVGTAAVQAGAPTAIGGAAGGATQAAIAGKDVGLSAAASFLTNLASGAYSSLKTPITTAELPSYAPVAGVGDTPLTKTGTVTVEQYVPSASELATWRDKGIISQADYDQGIKLAESQAGQADYATPTPQIVDQKILDLISQQTKSGGGAPSARLSVSDTTSGFGIKPGPGKGSSSSPLGKIDSTGSGSSGSGTGSGGGGTKAGTGKGTGEGEGDATSGYTPAPSTFTVGKAPSTQTSSTLGTSGGIGQSDSLSSALLGSGLSQRPDTGITGEPITLGEGKRKDVWNLESLRGALGV